MSIQDDIFDVEEALKGTPEAVSFERICNYFFKIENNEERLQKIMSDLRDGMSAWKKAMEVFNETDDL